MKNKDLRIGNLVFLNVTEPYYNNLESIEKIDNAYIFVVSDEDTEYRVSFKMLKPIPITEVGLEKLGFFLKENDGKYYHEKSTRVFVDINNPISITYNNNGGHVKQIEYIHQLQNLHFAMTEEELIFNYDFNP